MMTETLHTKMNHSDYNNPYKMIKDPFTWEAKMDKLIKEYYTKAYKKMGRNPNSIDPEVTEEVVEMMAEDILKLLEKIKIRIT